MYKFELLKLLFFGMWEKTYEIAQPTEKSRKYYSKYFSFRLYIEILLDLPISTEN